MRPLISTGDPRKSVDISRKAELYETSSGMLTITGGKLTTWRRMAKQVVDRMVEREGRVAPCRTDDIPLGMAASEHELDPPDGLAEADLPAGYRELLGVPLRPRGAQRAAAGRRAPRARARRSSTGQPDLLAEAAIAARLEQARSVADVLLRRTRLGLLAAPQLRDGRVGARRSPRRSAASSAGTRRGSRAEAERWVERRRRRGDRSGRPTGGKLARRSE